MKCAVQSAGIGQDPDDAVADLFVLSSHLRGRAIERGSIRSDTQDRRDLRPESLQLVGQRPGPANQLILRQLVRGVRRAAADVGDAVAEFKQLV